MKLVFVAVLYGASVLIHCRQGKHRSGLCGCFMFCLLTGCSFTDSLRAYRSRNRRVQGRDIGIVQRMWEENRMPWALQHFQSQQWVLNMIGNIIYKIFSVPRPLSHAQPKRRPLGDANARAARSRSRQPQPKRMPCARVATSSDADASAELAVIDADAERASSTVPQSVVLRRAQARADAEVLPHQSPSPTRGHRLAWTCETCGNLNNRTSHYCSRAGCRGRLPHRLQEGDWACVQCGHMNRHWRDRCNWSHCPSNDWECPQCGNLNFGDRRFCNRKDPPCTQPRPRSMQ